ncbi:MAG: hypothetical protein ACRCWF_08145 [Beijerinckiaceae bacterium]
MTEAQKAAPVTNKRQRTRSIAIAGGLVFLVVLFYLITIFKLGGAVVNRSM